MKKVDENWTYHLSKTTGEDAPVDASNNYVTLYVILGLVALGTYVVRNRR